MGMTKDSEKYFNQVAGKWDELRSGYFGLEVRDAAIAHAYLRPEMVVADVGAGTGFLSAGLASRVAKVYALDASQAMLDVAQRNLADFDNVVFQQAEGLSLPLPDASLDAVFANMYLHHCADPLAAIREMVRLLKPGGRLVITDLDKHTNSWMKAEMADVWLGFERDRVRAWLRESGLVNVLVDCTGQSCCAASEADSQNSRADISVFVAAGTRRVSMRDDVEQAYSAAASGGCGCGGGSSCCGVETDLQDVSILPDYTEADLEGMPLEAKEISLGCGNPLALAALKPGEVVLDIGSGGGLDSFLAAQRVAPDGRVIGVDMTPAMLERARAAAQRAGIANVEFREGQAEALPVGGGMVDVVISNCVINLVEDKGQAFREAFRVLKTGGRLEISDVVTSAALPQNLRENPGEWSACVSGALPEKEYLDLVREAGFVDVTARRSADNGVVDGTQIYSLKVSARKPAGGCGGSGCC
ncbi:methylase [Longilinea arvoryzae]|uniref:Methylase n=1 Tax=Longilinea arvoryzae TaxID=360412 RepID=A0A0S7BH16_9CHLR|nr:arsenite methyltransferase [Longilinea arvoryzae]GAP13346.1 methylase [Longilinea arvoryzae]